MTVGDMIKKMRTEAKLSQIELAQKIGVTQQQLLQWEKGQRKPKSEARKKIAEACGVEDNQLLELLSL